MSKLREKRIEAGPMQVALLREIGDRLLALQQIIEEQSPEGIVEPIAPFVATTSRRVVHPPFRDKFWFSVTIVKEGEVALNVVINTGKSGTTPYTMGADEKVYDQDFNVPCIEDVVVWTDSGSCTVKIRGSR